jgi:hypothetical protein
MALYTNLQKNETYNNARGKLVVYNSETARWSVKLLSLSGRLLSLKEENLKINPDTIVSIPATAVVADASILAVAAEGTAFKVAVGNRAVIHGLGGMGSYHNGKLVQIEGWVYVSFGCDSSALFAFARETAFIEHHTPFLPGWMSTENAVSR